LDAAPTIVDVWTKPGELSWYLPPPDAGPVFDSWAGSDRNRGQCRFGPVAVAASSLGIPVLIGPDASGQQVRVVDAETGALLARAPVSALRGCWRTWRVDLDAGIRRIAVEAEDDGAGWGQWTARGEPRWLR
jgi:hypothetical protein